jgi:pyrroline-5-carboxylate reductase
MPNLPVSIGQGATAIFCGGELQRDQVTQVKYLFSMVFASVVELQHEEWLDVSASISG